MTGESMQQSEQVQFQDQVAALGFVQLPIAVLRDSRVSDGALATYASLMVYARQDQRCWPGMERLGMDRGLTRRSISSHLSELKKAKLIATERRPGTSQVYWIIPMWTAYGKADAPHRFTDEAIEVCGLDEEGRIPRRSDVKVSKVVAPAPPPAMGDVATALASAQQRTEDARVERGKKQIKRQAARPKRPKPTKPEKSDALTPYRLGNHWVRLYNDKWPDLPSPIWGGAEGAIAKKMIAAYPELVLSVCERVIAHWEDYARRWSLDGQPTIRIVWGYRETLFAEAVQGKAPGGPKNEAMRADEFAADGEALEKPGW